MWIAHYTVAAGTCIITLTTSGAQTLTATYAGDSNFNTSTSAGEPHTVNQKTTPTITWANPADITYGTALSAAQLNATVPYLAPSYTPQHRAPC